MRRLFSVSLLSIVTLLLMSPGRHAEAASGTKAGTFYVGTCKPGKADFLTIASALTGVAAGSTINVCPGVYPEQVTITRSVTLQGLQVGDQAQVVIAAPSGTAVATIPVALAPLAAQVAVYNSNGPVNLSNLTIDGTGFASTGADIAGVVYNSSPGVINHVVVKNVVAASNQNAYAVTIRDDSASSPTVSIENSTLSFPAPAAQTAIYVTTLVGSGVTSGSTIVLTASNNTVAGSINGIWVEYGVAATLTGNQILGVQGPGEGLYAGNLKGALKINGNVVTGVDTGLDVLSSQSTATVSANTFIFYNVGINLSNPSAATVSVTDNQLFSLPNPPPRSPGFQWGFDLNCQSPLPTVSGNKFMGPLVALEQVPAGSSLQGSAGSFFGVPTIEQLCN
jgi:hypothetical protein